MNNTINHFEIDPWKIIQNHFEDETSIFHETIFSLANERFGTRGTFEEGYSGPTVEGNYFAGLYESIPLDGIWEMADFPTHKDFIMNSVRWIGLSLKLNGEKFDLAKSKYSDFTRTLDMRNGVLKRNVIWTDTTGRELKLSFERFMSMTDRMICAVRLTLEPLNFSSEITIKADLDFTYPHYLFNKQLWNHIKTESFNGLGLAAAQTETTKLDAVAVMALVSEGKILDPDENSCEENKVTQKYRIALEQGKSKSIEKVVSTTTTIDGLGDTNAMIKHIRTSLSNAINKGYDEIKNGSS